MSIGSYRRFQASQHLRIQGRGMTSPTLASYLPVTWRNTAEDLHLQQYHCENPRYQNSSLVSDLWGRLCSIMIVQVLGGNSNSFNVCSAVLHHIKLKNKNTCPRNETFSNENRSVRLSNKFCMNDANCTDFFLSFFLINDAVNCWDEWVWSIGWMIVTGENRTTRRKTCRSATLSTTNPTYTELGSKPGHRAERPYGYWERKLYWGKRRQMLK
jgi:hypothetical protein